MTNKKIKISIIIPIHNAEYYLNKCLDSIVNQSIKEIEIICINDGSTDRSIGILNEYASKDTRIIIIDRENRGVAFSRNEGIQIASGNYISFIDSDDFLENNYFYERLYTKAIEKNADIVKGNYKYDIDGFVYNDLNKNIRKNKNNFLGQFASAIYKNTFIKQHKILFPLISDMEDPVFAFNCAIYTNTIETIDDAYYIVVANPYSVTRRGLCYRQILDKIKGLNLIIAIANNAEIDATCYANVIGFWFVVIYNDIFKCTNIISKILAVIKMRKIYHTIKSNKKLDTYIKSNNCNPPVSIINQQNMLDFLTNDKELQNKIKDLIFPKKNKSITFWQKIFSIKNEYDKNKKKSKIIYLLGFKIKIKKGQINV